ncbi:hypothetical protein R3P38DRAFT_2746115 [Favolaschia claudopus]|uniref:Transmembrane protein n=1 Tax=Favolaschia claudopus TaxID=2862362 RepID=A0AAV9ZFF7_9AGAR
MRHSTTRGYHVATPIPSKAVEYVFGGISLVLSYIKSRHDLRRTPLPFSPRDLDRDRDPRLPFLCVEQDDTDSLLMSTGALSPGPKKYQSSHLLAILCLILHVTLVALHLTLLGVSQRNLEHNLEHNLVFSSSLETQQIVSFCITAITTSFVTIYSAALVFVTQLLSTRRSFSITQPLTTIHDTSAAWSGIGSAIMHIWKQCVVRASPISVLVVFSYLACIMGLQTTIPALFSLQSFNETLTLGLVTKGLPIYNASAFPVGSGDNSTLLNNLEVYLNNVLSAVALAPDDSAAPGLSGGTLYDILNPNPGDGEATVDAISVNVTCRYVNNFNMPLDNQTGVWDLEPTDWSGQFQSVDNLDPIGAQFSLWFIWDSSLFSICDLTYTQGVGITARPPSVQGIGNAVNFYTTAQIVDSNGDAGFHVELTPPLVKGVNMTAQILQCSTFLVPHTAVVAAQTSALISLEKNITKTHSIWPKPVTLLEAYNASLAIGANGQPIPSNITLLEMVPYILTLFSTTSSYVFKPDTFTPVGQPSSFSALSVPDLFLNLHLNPTALASRTPAPAVIPLHEFENSVSVFLAWMLWTLGNMPPAQWFTSVALKDLKATSNPLCLLPGKLMVTQLTLHTRLNLSNIAIIAGLVLSIALALLSLPATIFHLRGRNNTSRLPTDGTGILNTIWLYRNHPELETLVYQVEKPSDKNLRLAGMIEVNLAGEGGGGEKFD